MKQLIRKAKRILAMILAVLMAASLIDFGTFNTAQAQTPDAVASVTIGDDAPVEYTSYDEAMNAAKDKTATVKLLKDVSIDNSARGSGVCYTDISGQVVLDLNGKKIIGYNDDNTFSLFGVVSNGMLTVKGNGNIQINQGRIFWLKETNQTLNILDGVFESNDKTTNTNSALLVTISTDKTSIINIYGGTYTGGCVINLHGKATAHFYGGTFSGVVNVNTYADSTGNIRNLLGNSKCSWIDGNGKPLSESELNGNELTGTHSVKNDSVQCMVEQADYYVCQVKPQPTLSVGDHDIWKVTYTYAVRGSNDFTSNVPTTPGNYTIKAFFPATDDELEEYATDDFTILPHQMTNIAAKEPTCTEDGNVKYYTCSICNKNYSDEQGSQELTEVKEGEKLGHLMDETTGKCTRCDESVAKASVCMNDVTKYYEKLQSALDAVASATVEDNCIVKLLSDDINGYVVSDGTFTLDLGGHTLDGPSDASTLTVNGGELTVQNGTLSQYNRVNTITLNNGKLNLESGLNVISYKIYIYGLDIIGGTAEINGADFTVGKWSVCVNSGDLTVNSGSFSGSVEVDGGNVKLKGGSYMPDFTSNNVVVNGRETTGPDCGKIIYGINIGSLDAKDGITVDSLLADGFTYRSREEGKKWIDNTKDTMISNVTIEKIPVNIVSQPEAVPSLTYGYVKAPVLSVSAQKTEGIEASKLVTYQWFKDAVEENNLIVGAALESYTIPDNLPAGEHKYVCAVTCDDYTLISDTVTVTVGVLPLTKDDITVTGIKEEHYTGKEIKPVPSVVHNTKTLTEDTDYKVTYVSNTEVGTGSVKIDFCGNYSGSTCYEFNIVKYYKVSLTSCVDKLNDDTTVALLSGGGDCISGETVTVTAPDKEGYKFLGWYAADNSEKGYSDDIISNKLSYSFVPDEDTNMTAVYEANAKVALAISGSAFKVNGAEQTSGSYSENYTVGTKIALEATGENFAYWMNESNKIVSTSPTYEFTIVSNISYTPVYENAEDNTALVEFVSSYDQIIQAQRYSSSDTITLPDGPSKIGYTFTGWELTADGIINKIKNSETYIKPELFMEG